MPEWFWDFAIARQIFGKPDGLLPHWRCRLFGHRWWLCDPECCGPSYEHCARCLMPRKPSPITGRDKVWFSPR